MRILRSTDEESLLRTLPGRVNEIRFESELPIRRIGAEIGEIGSIVRLRRLRLAAKRKNPRLLKPPLPIAKMKRRLSNRLPQPSHR